MIKKVKLDFNSNLLIIDKLDNKIKIKRIFFLTAHKKVLRGDHAHKKCTQAFFSVKGNFYVECTNQNGKKKRINIKQGKKLEIIKPMTWVKVFLKKNDICGVLCDRYYEERDYIRDYKKFYLSSN